MMSSSKQTTLAGFFGKPKTGPAPPRPATAQSTVPPKPPAKPLSASRLQEHAPPSSSPASTSALKTPSSQLGSSPQRQHGTRRQRSGSPLKQSITVDELSSNDDLSPPPEISPAGNGLQARKPDAGKDTDLAEENADAGPSRRAKRKVVYAESQSGSSDDDEPLAARGKGMPPLSHQEGLRSTDQSTQAAGHARA